MFGSLAIKPDEETLGFELFHQTLVSHVFDFLAFYAVLRREFFDAERNVFQSGERLLGDRTVDVGSVHEVQQSGIFDVQITHVNAVGLRALAPRQRNCFAQRLHEAFDRMA